MAIPLLDGPRHAVGFLTRIPVPFTDGERPQLTSAAPWFPVVGLALGALAGAILALVGLIPGAASSGTAAAVALAVMLILTGAMHEDGLADCADGSGVLGDRERRLQVMRDPRVGTFGVLALIVWFAVTWSAVRGLGTGRDAVLALIAAGGLSRAGILVHVRCGRPARPAGDGAIHALRVNAVRLSAGLAVAVAAAGASLGVVAGLSASAGVIVVAVGGAVAARRSLGGLTGDTCGAVASLGFAVALVIALAFA